MQIDEPDPNEQEIQRINDPVNAVCNRLQKALEILRGEATPMQTASTANPVIERNISGNKAALEFLFLVGFSDDVIMDNLGKAEAYLVLKRNDPALLWLAKYALESC
ncbi:hypothetical protein PIB30_026717 [Stylosanthes scabra]|uniref:UBA domain-containing protein n=1 Tax=Stylosanthes scabra TaxID=79078 RepID=A0ABU6TBK2_9FABA|nr:hypothetical protein [Stylosanthes scabra]